MRCQTLESYKVTRGRADRYTGLVTRPDIQIARAVLPATRLACIF